jgi:hypothetical protein
MNDPHVTLLEYNFGHENTQDFSAAAPWEGELDGFRCRLGDGRLRVEPTRHFADSISARSAFEPLLEEWRLSAELSSGFEVSFYFAGSSTIDRNPPPGSRKMASGEAVAHIAFSVNAAGGRVHTDYPAPPSRHMARSALLDELIGYLRDLRSGGRLLVVANQILTRLEEAYQQSGGTRRDGHASS